MLKNKYERNKMSEEASFDATEEELKLSIDFDQSRDASSRTEQREKKQAASLLDLFRYATCGDALLMLVGSLFAAATGAGWPAMSIIFGKLTDTFVIGAVTHHDVDSNSSTQHGNMSDYNYIEDFDEKMTNYAIYYLYLAGGIMITAYIQVVCWTCACERQVNRIRAAFFQAIVRQEIGWFDQRQTGDLTARLVDDLEKIRNGIGDKFSFVIQNLFRFIIGMSIGFWESWKLTLVMLSLTPLMAGTTALRFKVATNISKLEQDCYAAAGSVATEVLSCIRTVISFNGQQQEKVRYEKALDAGKSLGIRKAVISGFFSGFFWFLLFSMYSLAFWYGSEQVKVYFDTDTKDGITPGAVITVFFCVQIGSYSLGFAAPYISAIMTAKGAGAVLFEVIDSKPEIDASSSDGLRPQEMKSDIHFVDVNFSYPARPDVTVFSNFTLNINEGQTVALVGPSGCGKSTVINLLQRFYDSAKGEIIIGGHKIKDLNLKWLRENIGVVSQDPVLFGFTIAENIKLGKPTATMEEIHKAAKQANAHDFIINLTNGYNTIVGERGSQLSGGQKQRVAIAQAIIRNPRILLLDEATSALDSENEKMVQAALDKARCGRTTIMVAHRLTTVQNADVINVMDKGEIVEYGTHTELMEKKSNYYSLVQAQSVATNNGECFQNGELESVPGSPTSIQSNTDFTVLKKRPPSKQKSYTSNSEELAPLQEEYGEPDEEPVPPKYLRILRENTPECSYIIFGCMASMIQGATLPTFAIVFSEMIKVFINQGQGNLFWSMMFLVIGGIFFFCYLLMNSCFGQSGERLVMRLRLKMFSAYLRQDVTFYDNPSHSTGAITTRLATDASLVKNATGSQVGTVLGAISSFLAALVIAFSYGWKLAFLVLGSVPIIMLSSLLKMKITVGNKAQDQGDLENAGKIASDTIENIRTVQSLTRETFFYNLYCGYLSKPLKSNLKRAQLYGLTFGFAQGLFFAVYGGVFRFGAWQVSLGEMQPENVYKVFFALAFTAMSVGQASSFLPDYSKAKQAAGSIFKALDMVPAIDIYSGKGTSVEEVAGKVEFKDVNFSYPMRPSMEVLSGINFKVNSGQTVALVGPSGCGKSTVFSLLQRFYDPNAGKIVLDGHCLCDLNLTKLRSAVTVVSQEPILFDCSIRDNIVYGLTGEIDSSKIIQAARDADIHDFITSLPSGYDTIVGEKGTQLSGGQKQRVAIARALIRNPKILLLDEATSALDTESENFVQAALDKAREGRTCIIIAHRLSTIQNVDKIFVMENGRIIESGTHQTLLAKQTAYAALVNAQHFTT